MSACLSASERERERERRERESARAGERFADQGPALKCGLYII
jgi:hypothetical protein